MASLKDLRRRIRSTKSMQQIFKAMEMVAAAKLRRAQGRAQSAAPYAKKITEVLSSIAGAAAEVMRRFPQAPVYTIHDAILTTCDWMNWVEAVWRDEFARYGIRPSFKRQVLRAA